MARRIHLLDELVANQIAAGEVIERPASVLKELIENSLDAGATRIDVEIEGNGTRLIRVTDNGCGMGREDALLCLERHATSKVKTPDDIVAIRSMGFRGEALPSIGSVARVRMRTAESGSAAGVEVKLAGGRIESVQETGSPPGTQIEVRQLFFNTPGRRKFLRSTETELGHLESVFRVVALVHPEVAWSYWVDGKPLFRLAPATDPLRRIEDVFGAEFVSWLVPVSGERQRIGLRGWIGRAGISRNARRDEFWFVNQRPVDNRALYYGLREGYHNALMKGRHPIGILMLDLPAEDVDVNVHPAKREVRFRREAAVRELVVESVRNALGFRHEEPVRPADMVSSLPRETVRLTNTGLAMAAERGADAPGDGARSIASPFSSDAGPEGRVLSALAPEISAVPGDLARANPASAPQREVDGGSDPGRGDGGPERPPLVLRGDAVRAVPARTAEMDLALPRVQVERPISEAFERFGPMQLRVLGIVRQLYIVAESANGLVLIDQHAAHERVLFERVLKQRLSGTAPSQGLLVPATVELSPKETAFVRPLLGELAGAGLMMREFGRNTFLVEGVPPFFPQERVPDLVLDLVSDLQAEGGDTRTARHLSEDFVTRAVCRRAIKANDRLRQGEIEALLKDLLACDLPYTCPHGRPTMILLGDGDLEKRFGRVV